jgi:hypothetical protein
VSTKLQLKVNEYKKNRETINGYPSEHLLTENGRSLCLTFKAVCLNFLRNLKSANYKELVEGLPNAQQTVVCIMSLNIHFLQSHVDFFPPNLGAVSDRYEGRFYQAISTMEKRYSGKRSQKVLYDCCWNFTEQVTNE